MCDLYLKIYYVIFNMTQFYFRDLTKLKRILKEMVSAIVTEFLQPEINGLIAREE